MLAGGACQAQTSPADQGGAHAQSTAGAVTSVPDLIAGVLHYTRWPTALEVVRLCIDADDPDAEAIGRRFLARDAARPRVVPSLRRLRAEPLLDCQAVYFGHANPKDLAPLLMQLVKLPILTIGHGEDFCSYAGLFCLIETPAGGVRFGANLDAISRSGLHINPQLLRLTARDPGGRL